MIGKLKRKFSTQEQKWINEAKDQVIYFTDSQEYNLIRIYVENFKIKMSPKSKIGNRNGIKD